MMLWAQMHGLQGHKRLHRHESREDREQYIRIQNYTVDMFGELLEPSWAYDLPEPDSIKDYLESYTEWECAVYSELAEIANELTVEGYPCEAELVSSGLPRKELERVRRMLTEYSMSGWDVSYILLRDKELHDKMKAKATES
jgi:hypothetical protein